MIVSRSTTIFWGLALALFLLMWVCFGSSTVFWVTGTAYYGRDMFLFWAFVIVMFAGFASSFSPSVIWWGSPMAEIIDWARAQEVNKSVAGIANPWQILQLVMSAIKDLEARLVRAIKELADGVTEMYAAVGAAPPLGATIESAKSVVAAWGVNMTALRDKALAELTSLYQEVSRISGATVATTADALQQLAALYLLVKSHVDGIKTVLPAAEWEASFDTPTGWHNLLLKFRNLFAVQQAKQEQLATELDVSKAHIIRLNQAVADALRGSADAGTAQLTALTRLRETSLQLNDGYNKELEALRKTPQLHQDVIDQSIKAAVIRERAKEILSDDVAKARIDDLEGKLTQSVRFMGNFKGAAEFLAENDKEPSVLAGTLLARKDQAEQSERTRKPESTRRPRQSRPDPKDPNQRPNPQDQKPDEAKPADKEQGPATGPESIKS